MIRIIQLVIAVLFAMALHAQTAQIQGIVQDSSGAAVPGAEVKVVRLDTGAVRVVNTANDGVYVLADLPVGPYRLEVTKPGFATYVQSGIVLQVATNPTIDIQLKVGAVSEQVQVEANATLVESATTSIGQVIENERILDLPLNGRRVTDLIQLTGATIGAGVTGRAASPAVSIFPSREDNRSAWVISSTACCMPPVIQRRIILSRSRTPYKNSKSRPVRWGRRTGRNPARRLTLLQNRELMRSMAISSSSCATGI